MITQYEETEEETDDEEKPKCQLVGTDPNVFSIIGHVERTLKRAGLREKADEFREKAFACGSYDEVIQLAFDYVVVT